MKSMASKKISRFFGEASFSRDELFFEDLILGYEQNMRQTSIASFIAKERYSVALDAGCGNGRDVSLILGSSARLIGMDFSSDMVRNAKQKIDALGVKERVDLIVGDVTHLPFRDSTFDLVSCSEVLEHVPFWKVSFLEFKRILKFHGTLIVSTPNKLSMYGLVRYPARFLLGSKHPYDKWKSFSQLEKEMRKSGFRFVSGRGACFLPGDLSYYNPVRNMLTKILRNIKIIELRLCDRKPWLYIGYMTVVKGNKDHD
jgi:ubiquinone/menaquinone biosynthesis C-methylase UbiE